MPDRITIRPATLDDAAALVDLRERMLRELDRIDDKRLARLADHSRAWFGSALQDGGAYGWLAERDGRLVGGLSMTIIRTQPQYRALDGRVASIFGLYVEPAQRGVGIATRLVRMAVEHARTLGFDLVTLHAAEKARPLYERIGFEASSEMRLFLGE